MRPFICESSLCWIYTCICLWNTYGSIMVKMAIQNFYLHYNMKTVLAVFTITWKSASLVMRFCQGLAVVSKYLGHIVPSHSCTIYSKSQSKIVRERKGITIYRENHFLKGFWDFFVNISTRALARVEIDKKVDFPKISSSPL